MPEPLHLAWFLQGSSAQAWGEPWTGLVGTSWMVPELFTDLARVLERACFDYVLIEDSSYIGESYGASTAIYLENAIAVPRQDPSVIASLMTTVTSRIGIVPTFGTYAYHPYLLARLVATLDQVSSGRIGWNAVTRSSDYAAMNFGLPGMPSMICAMIWPTNTWRQSALFGLRGTRALSSPTGKAAFLSIRRRYITPISTGLGSGRAGP